jgi:hypothetical protein
MNGASANLLELARDIGRLRPDWRDPERFFEERDELERRAKRLARRIEGKVHG